ncbi:MAG: phosphoethanolamine transferase [Bacteroidaceae bacterium]|nr:phosphoethanolamine transferase [Bacteroidaceae bacterium]
MVVNKINKIVELIDNKRFFIFLILNILASSVVFFDLSYLYNWTGIITLVSMSSFISFGICLVSSFLKRVKWLQLSFEILCLGVLLIYWLVDVFLLVNFSITINETIFNIIEGTNINESKDFVKTYINGKTIFSIAGVLFIFLVTFKYIPNVVERIPKKILSCFVWAAVLFSFCKLALSVYSMVFYGFGGHLAAFSTYSRVARAYVIYRNTSKETELLISNLQNMDITYAEPKCDKMIVIIGESYSKYHSQLYGYDKSTSPLLTEKAKSDEFILYTDVLTPINDTERAFRAIYSLGEYYKDSYCNFALFPYLFKKAGWHTCYFDNMDLASQTSRIKDSKQLSDVMYDYRNTITYQYDEKILDCLNVDESVHSNQLLVIKLKGQHYTYANTFPESYNHFVVSDYNHLDWSDNIRQVIADYDNSTLYNDYVVNSIIEKFKEDNAVIIYFSDHGEEVYDAREYMGHGGTTPFLNYQVEIPFMIWVSDSYKENNPMEVDNLMKHKDEPYITDDVSHTILDLAGIYCNQFVAQRSIANGAFIPREKRMVNKSIEY